MAVKITIRPAANTQATIDIDAQVIKDVESTYASLLKNPGSEVHIGFENEDERISWSRQARAYCTTRPNGALRFRQLPSKNLPVNEGRYQITADLEENGNRNGRRKQA
jgi:hypothetical protein